MHTMSGRANACAKETRMVVVECKVKGGFDVLSDLQKDEWIALG